MSDDDFYDEEGDDFEGDLFWNDDGEIILADDLAEHTLPSPVYVEHPAYETIDGSSDWEYYSDDYYDDDPILLKNNPQEGSPLQGSKLIRSNGAQRGKKRKLAATSNIPNLSLEGELDDKPAVTRPWFKGTVWRLSSPERKEKKLYQPGMGDRVALLDNWREVFKSSQPLGQDSRKSSRSSRKPGPRTTKTMVDLPRTEPTNGHIHGAGAVKMEENDMVEPRGRKRRRVSIERELQGPPGHKVVVEIPPPRANGMGKSGPSTQNKTEQKSLASRKRKVGQLESEKTDGDNGSARSKRGAPGRAPRKGQNNGKAASSPAPSITRSKPR